jgi:hypothetical protein
MPPSRGGSRSLGALDDLFIECRERAADAAHFGHDHSRIYLCGTVRIVIFWRGGLRPALAHSLKIGAMNRQIQHADATQITNAAHRNRGLGERHYNRHGKHRCHRPKQSYGP